MGRMEEIAEEAYKVTSYECGKCGYTCDWKGQLEIHLFTVHEISVDISE